MAKTAMSKMKMVREFSANYYRTPREKGFLKERKLRRARFRLYQGKSDPGLDMIQRTITRVLMGGDFTLPTPRQGGSVMGHRQETDLQGFLEFFGQVSGGPSADIASRP
ncbi:hypothetical protein HAX54_043951 [Datura stramonium]|uniref:Ribosomal protein S14 n=1 Tax=Datura stramonium TaxID=4076 RepID=A0ABS8W3I5_DATST|nr:hypothetical protein [Datura stramonium]